MNYRRLAVYLSIFGLIALTGCSKLPPSLQLSRSRPTPQPTPVSLLAPFESGLGIFAASSLTDALQDIGREFQAGHTWAHVEYNFGASQTLRMQLQQGAKADIFASANQREMDAAVDSGVVKAGTAKPFAHNRLVVITPVDNPGHIDKLQDLAKPGIKIAVAAPGVPLADYTTQVLTKMSSDPSFGATFSNTVASNIISRESDSRQVVSKVLLGEADAAIVYASDANAQQASQVHQFAIPDPFNVLSTYFIAPVKSNMQPTVVDEFIDNYVLSTSGQQTLKKWGFIPIAEGQ